MKKKIGWVICLIFVVLSMTIILVSCQSGSNSADKMDDITLDHYNISMVTGERKQINATVNLDDKTVAWTSTNPDIATVSDDGTVTAKSEGSAVIMATTSNGKTVSCVVTVHEHKTETKVENKIAATCTENGSYDVVEFCTTCGAELYIEKEIEYSFGGHTYSNCSCIRCGHTVAESSEGLEFRLNSDKKSYTVTGRGTCTASELVIGLYNDLPVTHIAEDAFASNTLFTSVVIEDTVTSIGYRAFNTAYFITNVKLGDNVEKIGAYAFYSCDNLTSVTTIPDSVTSIGEGAFGAPNLTNIVVSEDNKFYCCVEGNLYSKDKKTLIQYAAGRLNSSFTIPNYVTSIGSYAFYDCESLKSVVIPDSVTSIGKYAFEYCSELVEVINKSAFDIRAGSSDYGGVGYYAIEVHSGGSKIVNKDGYLFYSYDGVNYLLGYTGNETELTLPENYNGESYEIYREAFYSCDSLTSIVIPDSVTSIGSYAFSVCTNLTSVVIPDSVTSIGDWAFYYCTSLTSIVIPDSVTSIGKNAFYDCRSLTSVYISDIAAWCGISFGDNSLYYAHNLYLNGDLVTELVIPNGVTSIGEDAFAYCTSLTSVTIPDSVTSIGESAFVGCYSLTSVYISDIAAWCGISFGDNPLYYAHNLYLNGDLVTELVIPNGVTSIGEDAFAYCTSLTSVTIPDSVTSIGKNAFAYCTRLTSVTIPDSVTSIGGNAFRNCTNLMSVTIPDSVTSIGESAFVGCYSLTSIVIPDSVTYIGNTAFYCWVLVDVYYAGTESQWEQICDGTVVPSETIIHYGS